MLVNGEWNADWDPVQKQDTEGRFVRQSSAFRERLAGIREQELYLDGGERRFCLYAVYICPWATRTLIARSLLGLDKSIDCIIGEPAITDRGWAFATQETVSTYSNTAEQAGVEFIYQLYQKADERYTGRATVPVLWDRQQQCIVNNESADILRIFNDDLRPLHNSSLNLAPDSLLPEIDAFNHRIYDALNNGVYRAGFAQSQSAYREAYAEVFSCLDYLEDHFSQNTYAVGNTLTESDIRLFVTLVRFDLAYFGLFKVNKKTIAEYAALSDYLQRLLQLPAFAQHTHPEHIKQGYYSIKKLNPSGIVPEGPELSWLPLVR